MPHTDKGYNGIGEILIDQGRIQARIEELAERIASDYADSECLAVIGVLKGAFFFMADLLRRIPLPMESDFVYVSTYEDQTAPSRLPEVLLSTGLKVRGKRVLIVEDIVDSGATLDFLLRRLADSGPSDLRVCALLDKKARRRFPVQLDYVGFEIPDRFVVGYGLDYSGRYRNLPYIAVLAGT